MSSSTRSADNPAAIDEERASATKPPRPPGVRTPAWVGTLLVGAIAFALGVALGYAVPRPTGSLDDNSKDVLVVFIGGILGLATGLSVAVIGLRHSRSLEEERFAREDRHRFTATKAANYQRLLEACELAAQAITASATSPVTEAEIATASAQYDQASAAADVVKILATDAVRAKVFAYLGPMYAFYSAADEIGAEDDPEKHKAAIKAHFDALEQAKKELVEELHLDLGVPR